MIVEILAYCIGSNTSCLVRKAAQTCGCLANIADTLRAEQESFVLLDAEQHRYLFLQDCGLLKMVKLRWEKHRFNAFNWCCVFIPLDAKNAGTKVPFGHPHSVKFLMSMMRW